MKQGKKGLYVIIVLFTFILALSFISAGFWDTITGKATSRPTNVSVSITGIGIAIINYVMPIAATLPSEETFKQIVFEVHVNDSDGVNDVNDTSVNATFTRTGQTSRSTGNSGTCAWRNDIDSYTANFTCNISVWYYDENGTWNINVQGKDLGNLSWAVNNTATYTLNQLKALTIAPTVLNWAPLSGGDTNKESTNDPTIINNTGNYNGTVKIKAYDLLGATDPSNSINSANFTTNTTSSNTCTKAVTLANNTEKSIDDSYTNPGNLSAGSNNGQSFLYYCIPSVPYVPSQTYSTPAGEDWIISY